MAGVLCNLLGLWVKQASWPVMSDWMVRGGGWPGKGHPPSPTEVPCPEFPPFPALEVLPRAPQSCLECLPGLVLNQGALLSHRDKDSWGGKWEPFRLHGSPLGRLVFSVCCVPHSSDPPWESMVLKEPAVPLSLLTCSGAKSKASSTSLPAPPRLMEGGSGVGPITAWGKWERKGEGKGFLWLF